MYVGIHTYNMSLLSRNEKTRREYVFCVFTGVALADCLVAFRHMMLYLFFELVPVHVYVWHLITDVSYLYIIIT